MSIILENARGLSTIAVKIKRNRKPANLAALYCDRFGTRFFHIVEFIKPDFSLHNKTFFNRFVNDHGWIESLDKQPDA